MAKLVYFVAVVFHYCHNELDHQRVEFGQVVLLVGVVEVVVVVVVVRLMMGFFVLFYLIYMCRPGVSNFFFLEFDPFCKSEGNGRGGGLEGGGGACSIVYIC